MKLSVVGAGYVGLVTAVGFASKGHEVTCIDSDKKKVDLINRGNAPIYEEGLDGLLKKCGKNLKATSSYDAVSSSDVTFICVGTPSNPDGSINLDQIKMACKQIGAAIAGKKGYQLVVVKSTVVPGTTEKSIIPILDKNSGKKCGKGFGVCVNPEFLREGRALHDFFHQDRIVVGQHDERSGDVLRGLFEGAGAPILKTDLKTAEMIKYASNAFLATKISFINEIGNICKRLGIDTYKVAEGIGYDHRIGRAFLDAGIGFGGACFPKDMRALMSKALETGYKPKILRSALDVNECQPLLLVSLLKEKIRGVRGKKIAALGLAFKAGTDDMRESRSIQIINQLLKEGAVVIAHDPKAMENAKRIFGGAVRYARNLEDAVKACDALLVLTDWPEFKELEKMRKLLKGKTIIEGRKLLDRKKVEKFCHIEGICW